MDGPGNRVVLYLQGCHLRCPWCHSPHSWETEAPLLFNPVRCLGCQRCAEVCAHGVHSFINGEHLIERANCTRCGRCVHVCPTVRRGSLSGALALPPQELSVPEVFELLRPQLEVVQHCGGITLSGGEALLQKEDVRNLLTLCKAHQIHTALETSLTLPTPVYAYVSDLVDCWLVGLRDPGLVGGNATDDLIKDNVRYLASLQTQIIVRYPVIRGYTDSPEQLERLNTLMRLGDFTEIEILPCNPDMNHYYRLSGLELALPVEEVLPDEMLLREIAAYFQQSGCGVTIRK